MIAIGIIGYQIRNTLDKLKPHRKQREMFCLPAVLHSTVRNFNHIEICSHSPQQAAGNVFAAAIQYVLIFLSVVCRVGAI
jgi:hypothetical protein